jgi:hypothetical protein
LLKFTLCQRKDYSGTEAFEERNGGRFLPLCVHNIQQIIRSMEKFPGAR